jgi:small subunit ribosomal protein S5
MARRDEQRGDRRQRDEERDSDIVEKLVHINRVAATVKGGRRFSFAALMVVGDQKGRVGFGHGKAREVPEAIRKATEEAKKSMIRVPLRESRTLHHDGDGRWGAGKVMVRAAPPGTGVIAGGPMRAVLETLGIQDVVGKSVGSSNPYNMVRATFEALKAQSSPRQVAAKRAQRVRTRLKSLANGRPRLSVFRSSKNIYAQVIDDERGVTLASASTLEGEGKATGANKDAAALVGKLVAERAIEKGVKDVVFDRGGYIFHGRVKALADAAREAGLNF